MVSVRQVMNGRICGGALITRFVTLTAACCTHPYERQPSFGGLFLHILNDIYDIIYMESHPNYNCTGAEDFNIGIITVSNLISFEECHRKMNIPIF